MGDLMRHTLSLLALRSRAARRAPGFTLIELLTVIAIIAILAAILVPVVGKVRDTARFSTGTANVRTWATAMVMFANENRGFLPHQGTSPANPSNPLNLLSNSNRIPAWYNALPPYIGSGVASLADIPADQLPRAGDRSIWVCPRFDPGNTTARAWLSYGPSAFISETPHATNTRYITNLNRLPAWVGTDHSRLAIFGETTNGSPGVSTEFATSTPNVAADNDGLWQNNRWGGTSGRANVGFADGSVRAFTSTELRDMNRSANGVSAQQARRGQNPRGVIWETRGAP